MEHKILEADVLCVGGGIAGLMASIRAAESGARVVLAEKGDTRFSGAGRAGNDHFWAYIPEVHGPDMDYFIKECMLTQLGAGCAPLSKTIIHTWMEKSFDMVKLWDSWGIPMKYHGGWEFAGHSFPGRVMTHLKYSGKNQKKILSEQAVKRGVEIVNRVMIFDLIRNPQGITGALGVDTRENKIVIFAAKTIILGTGYATRMYPGVTPALMGNDPFPFSGTGDGRAMAYQAGAELINMESIAQHAGIKYFARCGQATWIGVYRGPEGKPLGPYVTRPDKRYGDILPEVDKQLFARLMKTGSGPAYMDCTGASQEDYEYMKYWLLNEGNRGLLNYFQEEGIDPLKNPLEFMTYNLAISGRIFTNEKAETTIPALYSAGDESTFSISGAAVFGWISGEEAAEYSKSITLADIDKRLVDDKVNLIRTLRDRERGHDWKDANIALQQIMYDYAGLTRSEPMLSAGLVHLKRLKNKILRTLKAGNQWELIRCLEVLNLCDLGELVFLSALERKESRGLQRRIDYPLTDPTLNDKVLGIRKVNERPVLEWKAI